MNAGKLCLDVIYGCVMDRYNRRVVCRSCESPDLVEVLGFKEVGAMCCVGYLYALVRILSERSENFREGLGLNRVLEKFRLLNREADHSVSGRCARLR